MIVRFKSKRLEMELNNYQKMKKKHSERYANSVFERINLLNNIECLEEMRLTKLGNFHKLDGNLKNRYALNICDGKRMIIISVPEDEVDLRKVTEVIIEKIIDYH